MRRRNNAWKNVPFIVAAFFVFSRQVIVQHRLAVEVATLHTTSTATKEEAAFQIPSVAIHKNVSTSSTSPAHNNNNNGLKSMIIPKQRQQKPYSETGHIKDFEKNHRVNAVIVVKIHSKRGCILELMQSLCLLKVAYNGRMQYDHLVFSSRPVKEEIRRILEEIVAPAKIRFVLDTKPLPDVLEDLTVKQQKTLEEQCSVTSFKN
jgi:hypothetical protein